MRITRPTPPDRLVRLAIRLGAVAGILFSLAIGAADARAHARSVSYSRWEIDDTGADVVLRMPLLELSRLGPEALPPLDGASERLAAQLVLESDGVACAPSTGVRRSADAEGWVRYRWRVVCAAGRGALAVRSGVLLDVAPSHLHFARVRFASGDGRVREGVLSEARPRFELRVASDAGGAAGDGGAQAVGSRFVDYVALGVRHILSGWDHLAFLLGLVLLADRLGAIARLVTGFTLAHSLTLALAVLDVVHPRAAAAEAVIAYSVALVAVEKGWLVAGRPPSIPIGVLAGLGGLALATTCFGGALEVASLLGLMLFTGCYFALSARSRDERLRIALTFAFGLVHGFGFAGLLRELDLPTTRLVPALAGFNLGVELGQIAIVLVVWPVLALAAGSLRRAFQDAARDLATAGLCGLGCFWLLERAFSG